ncbi:uncharacterized protein LOC119053588 [Artibeus jamaicensis]|uniref:uncharacterized protein LOC119053588 n=1 Tax=Artibeus jamaicensis TaxID=9417 RepID=UPI00235AAB77|nr:uncharacterized protein LOC119053588 [Artibeus jamaicensis]
MFLPLRHARGPTFPPNLQLMFAVLWAEEDLSTSLQLTCDSQASPVLDISGQNRVFSQELQPSGRQSLPTVLGRCLSQDQEPLEDVPSTWSRAQPTVGAQQNILSEWMNDSV